MTSSTKPSIYAEIYHSVPYSIKYTSLYFIFVREIHMHIGVTFHILGYPVVSDIPQVSMAMLLPNGTEATAEDLERDDLTWALKWVIILLKWLNLEGDTFVCTCKACDILLLNICMQWCAVSCFCTLRDAIVLWTVYGSHKISQYPITCHLWRTHTRTKVSDHMQANEIKCHYTMTHPLQILNTTFQWIMTKYFGYDWPCWNGTALYCGNGSDGFPSCFRCVSLSVSYYEFTKKHSITHPHGRAMECLYEYFGNY